MNRRRDRCRSSCRPSLPRVSASHLRPPEVKVPNQRHRCFLARRPKPAPICSPESKPNLYHGAVPNARSNRLPTRNLRSKSRSSLGPYKPNARRYRASSYLPKPRRRVARLHHMLGSQTSGHLTAVPDRRRHKIAGLQALGSSPRRNECFARTLPNALPQEGPEDQLVLSRSGHFAPVDLLVLAASCCCCDCPVRVDARHSPATTQAPRSQKSDCS